jgi:hypothetical protein
MTPWDAARWRQRQYTPRVVKMHGPVGGLSQAGGDAQYDTCLDCGYHLCAPTCEHAKYNARFCDGCDRLVCVCDERGPLATHAPVYGYWPVEHVTREQVAYMYPVQKAIEHGQTANLSDHAFALSGVCADLIGREVPPEPMTPCPEAFGVAYDEQKQRARVLPADRALAIALLTSGAYPGCAHCSQPDDMPHVEGCPMLIPPFKRPWGKYLADQEND